MTGDDGVAVSAETIRAWMGHFNHIKIPAKYAARLGQCFSSTKPIPICAEQVVEIADIERNGYCFSDGIGRISRSLAESIAVDLGFEVMGDVPSAYQASLSK